MPRRIIQCRECGRTRQHIQSGLCAACSHRARRNDPTRPRCPECSTRAVTVRGYCAQCYNRLLAQGTLQKLPERSVMERIEAKLLKVGDCLVDVGANEIWDGSVRMTKRRAVWLASGRDLPEDRQIVHTCSNLRCLNIEHLAIGPPRRFPVD